MEYTIDKEDLKGKIIKEISRLAAESRGDDGSSLFDAYKVLSRDHDTILDYIDAGIDAICVALIGITTKKDGALTFTVPDFISSMEGAVGKELESYIVYHACSLWVEDKSMTESDTYKKRAESALTNANILLKTRKSPK